LASTRCLLYVSAPSAKSAPTSPSKRFPLECGSSATAFSIQTSTPNLNLSSLDHANVNLSAIPPKKIPPQRIGHSRAHHHKNSLLIPPVVCDHFPRTTPAPIL